MTIKTLWREIISLPNYIQWLIFKLANKNTYPEESSDNSRVVNNILEKKEINLQKILKMNKGKSFLEVGIGPGPHFDRLQLIVSNSLRYVGCDFDYVCKSHQKELVKKGVKSKKIEFKSNRNGTYSWTLFQMLQSGEKFDVIYFDGSHTFYTDLPALILSHHLLKSGGFLILDDLDWTLSFLKRNMLRTFHDWDFYHQMYDFSQYSEKQQNIAHIRLIANELFIHQLAYKPLKKYQVFDWQVFVKP